MESPNPGRMRHLLVALLLCLPALAEPSSEVERLFPAREPEVRVERVGGEVRVRGDGPLRVRTRAVGGKMRLDLSPATSVAGPVPTGLVASRPLPGTVRLEWPAPPRSVARCVREADGSVRVVLARAARGPTRDGLTMDFVNADLPYVIKVIAKSMGRNLYIGPGVEEAVTLQVRNAPPEALLALMLEERELDYQWMTGETGPTLVVASPEKLQMMRNPPDCNRPAEGVVIGCPQEILLEKASAAKVMAFLSSQYPDVQFRPHPTMNGFYLFGSKKDVLAIKAEVPNLDRVAEPPLPPVTEIVPVRYGDIQEVKTLLATLVPDVAYEVVGRALRLTGAPLAVDQVKELLAEFDHPTNLVMLYVKLLDVTPAQEQALGLDTERPQVLVLERQPLKTPNGLSPLSSSTSQAKVLRSPQMATESGHPVFFRLGEPFRVVWFDPVSGEFKDSVEDLGLRIGALPTISSDGSIDLDLEVETRFLTALLSDQYPSAVTQECDRSVRIRDGDTVVVGNFYPEQAVEVARAHPGLEDVYWLRATTPGRHLVLMITPHVMK